MFVMPPRGGWEIKSVNLAKWKASADDDGDLRRATACQSESKAELGPRAYEKGIVVKEH